MRKMTRNRILTLLLAALLICIFLIPAAAMDPPDASKTGSISVTVDAGGTMTLFQVAEYHKENHTFVATPLFEDSGFDPEHLEADDAVALWEFIESLQGTPNELFGQTKKIVNGSVTFDSLPLGIYLLVHEGSSGKPEVLPFFVTIPMQEDGKYIYDVNANSKAKPYPSPSPSTSPEPSPSPSPSTSPEPSPSPSPSVSPEPSPGASPEPSPGASPEPSPSISPEPSPEVSPELSISPSISPEPSPGTSPEVSPSLSPSNPPSNPTTSPSTSGSTLPNTGQLSWPIPLLVILGLVLFGIGWYLHQKRNHD